MRRTAAALAALLALAVGLTACDGPGDSGTAGAGAAGGGPVRGGTLTVGYQGEPATLDPAIAWELEAWSIERLTYQTLLTYASEEGEAGTEPVPELATEVPTVENGGVSAAGTVYTFHLRPGIRFAPPVGTEVTAADFKWSFERMMRQPGAPATRFYAGVAGARAFLDGEADEITGCRVVDDTTIEITLEQADAAFLQAMTLPFTSVMSREWCERVGEQIGHRPLGTGPYVITGWEPGRSITAERNAAWSGPGQWLDTIVFDFTAGPDAQLLRLERGEVDLLGDPVPAAAWTRLRDDPAPGVRAVAAPQVAWDYLFLNVLEEPFTDVRVRRAVSLAVDRGRIGRLLAGQGAALGQLYPAGLPGHEAGAVFYAHDPATAKELLAEAGYPAGFTTTLVTHDAGPFPSIARAVQADLAAVGIDCRVRELDRAGYWDHITRRESHAAIGLSNWYMDLPDPSDWIGPLFTAPGEGGANASFYESPEVEALYRRAAAEADPAARIRLFRRIQDVIMRDAPAVPLWQPRWTGAHGSTTGGVYVHPVWVYAYQEFWKTDGT